MGLSCKTLSFCPKKYFICFTWNKMSNYTQAQGVLYKPIYKIMKIVCQLTMFHVKQKNAVIVWHFWLFCLQINLKTGKIQSYTIDFDSFFVFYALNRDKNPTKTIRKNSCLRLLLLKTFRNRYYLLKKKQKNEQKQTKMCKKQKKHSWFVIFFFIIWCFTWNIFVKRLIK